MEPAKNLLRYPNNTYNTMYQLLNQQIEARTDYSKLLEEYDVESSVESLASKNIFGKFELKNTAQFILSAIAVGEAFSKFLNSIGLLVSALISDIACTLVSIIVGIEFLFGTIMYRASMAIANCCPESISEKIKNLSKLGSAAGYMHLCVMIFVITQFSMFIQNIIDTIFDALSSLTGIAITFLCAIVGGVVGGIIDALMLCPIISTSTERLVTTVSSVTHQPLKMLSDNASKAYGFWFPKTDNVHNTLQKDQAFSEKVKDEFMKTTRDLILKTS